MNTLRMYSNERMPANGEKQTPSDVIDDSMFRFIWRYSRRDQLMILVMVLLSLPFYFLSLDLPKTIVNKAIQGEGFEGGGTQTAFDVTLPLWGLGGRDGIALFGGIDLERIPFLVWMSFAFLALVIVNGLFKLWINTAKGRLGERMLRRLRFMLFDRVLRFPPERYRTVKAPELATMIKDEVEPLGGFIGDAYAQPIFLGGQVLTALTFILIQNVWLGAVAGAIALTQAMLVPRLRAPILALGRERQLTARQLARRIGESVDGIAEIRVNDTATYERAAIGDLLGKILSIRFRLYQKKFQVKFINNLLAQMTPFVFFLVGGYFAIVGKLDIGQLVAVIVAYKELPGPMKELIDWDQRRLDGEIKYQLVTSQLTLDAPPTSAASAPEEHAAPASLEAVNLTISDEDVPVVDHLSIAIPPGQTVLLSGAGAAPFLEALARLRTPDGGTVLFGGRALDDLPVGVTGRRISYIGETAHLAGASAFDALAYGLLHVPSDPADSKAAEEARASGNPVHGIGGDWIDYARAGVATRDALKARMLDILRIVEIDAELYAWGLRQPVGPQVDGAQLLRARRLVAERLQHHDHSGLVERFDATAYNSNATVGENLMFGAVSSPDALDGLGQARKALREAGIEDALISVGREIGETMIELFADLPPDSPLVEQFSFVAAEDLPVIETILARDRLDGADSDRLLALVFQYCEVRHRLDLVTPELESGVVKARQIFRSTLPEAVSGAICFYDVDRPTVGALLIDDILFGKISRTVGDAGERIETLVHDVLEEQDLLPVVLEAGLASPIGGAGRRLSASQRQRLAVARALLRRSDVLLVNHALAVLNHQQERRILSGILEHCADATVLAALGGDRGGALFDRSIVFDGARMVADRIEDGVDEGVTWD